MENGAGFGAGSRDCSYGGREIGERERERDRESVAVLYGGEIVAVWFHLVWFGLVCCVDRRLESCEERWRTEQRKGLCCYVGVPQILKKKQTTTIKWQNVYMSQN